MQNKNILIVIIADIFNLTYTFKTPAYSAYGNKRLSINQSCGISLLLKNFRVF